MGQCATQKNISESDVWKIFIVVNLKEGTPKVNKDESSILIISWRFLHVHIIRQKIFRP